MPLDQSTVEKPSVCPLDCPDTCSLTVTVENDKIVKIRGSEANPLTDGVLCNKVTRYYPEFVHGDNRLTHPLRRTGPRGGDSFERISWEEALDEIHARTAAAIEKHGPQTVLPMSYAGPHGQLAMESMSARFFNKLGATQLWRVPMCGGIKSQAWAGTMGAVPGMRPESADAAKLVIVWGNNVTYSNLHLAPLLKQVRQRGGKVVVIDPKRIKVAEQADMHMSLKPGTDVVLAWALAAELERLGAFDQAFIDAHVKGAEAFMADARGWDVPRAAAECGVPEDQILELARWYAEADPATISIGNGLERNRNGGSGIRAAIALAALAGKFGKHGGGVIAGAGNAFPKTGAKLQRPDFIPEGTRTLNIMDLGRHLTQDDLDPPIRAAFIYNHNPLIVQADQNQFRKALEREDIFYAGIEVAFTDSMRFCDIVLPACSHFEHDDIFTAYGQHYLQRAAPVIPPVGEALPNTEIFRRLAARFGFDDPAFTASDMDLMDDALDAEDPRLKGMRPSALPLGEALAMEYDGGEAILFANVFPKTPSGKVEIDSEMLAKSYGAALPTYERLEDPYPLWLITPSSDRRTTSTFGGTSGSTKTPALEMHPDDATARGLTDGAKIKVWNDLGEVHLPLRVTDAVRPGCVYSAKGAWMRTSDNGQTVSALAPTTKADICEGACYNDARVEVAAL